MSASTDLKVAKATNRHQAKNGLRTNVMCIGGVDRGLELNKINQRVGTMRIEANLPVKFAIIAHYDSRFFKQWKCNQS